jgi:SP family general alpha glucoside:H+ symporter-like MFS transporter
MIWCYLRVPEIRGRTYKELELMFARGVPSREFRTHKIEYGIFAV